MQLPAWLPATPASHISQLSRLSTFTASAHCLYPVQISLFLLADSLGQAPLYHFILCLCSAISDCPFHSLDRHDLLIHLTRNATAQDCVYDSVGHSSCYDRPSMTRYMILTELYCCLCPLSLFHRACTSHWWETWELYCEMRFRNLQIQ